MKKISSTTTFLNKRIFPIFWFGFLSLFFCVGVFIDGDDGPGIMFFVMPIVMAVFGFFIMKIFIFDLIDEVYDQGDFLIFKNSNEEVRVYLRDIKNVNYQVMMNPARVTISVRHNTNFGSEISFSPKISIIPFKKNKDIEDLIDRIDKVRG